jgi:hypothetical protein
MSIFDEPQKVIVTYDKTLQLITEKEEEECFISPKLSFLIFFHMVLQSYPEIQKRFAPGVLGFTVNGKPPELDAKLQDGDTIHFSVPHLGDHLIEGQ